MYAHEGDDVGSFIRKLESEFWVVVKYLLFENWELRSGDRTTVFYYERMNVKRKLVVNTCSSLSAYLSLWQIDGVVHKIPDSLQMLSNIHLIKDAMPYNYCIIYLRNSYSISIFLWSLLFTHSKFNFGAAKSTQSAMTEHRSSGVEVVMTENNANENKNNRAR